MRRIRQLVRMVAEWREERRRVRLYRDMLGIGLPVMVTPMRRGVRITTHWGGSARRMRPGTAAMYTRAMQQRLSGR